MAALRSFKRIPAPLQLLLLLLLQHLVVTGQKIEVTQLPETISVKAGETITLKCTLTGANLTEGVRWYKVMGRNRETIYWDKPGASNQGVRVIPGSNTDFSIYIQNIRPDDAGIYYCVKIHAGNPETELASGKGTLVSVIAMPSHPVIIGPTGRITAGSHASFSCYTGGFSPQHIKVSWLKDGKKIPAAPANILNSDVNESISYRAKSTVEILLEQGDVKSQLTCRIQHTSLDGPLQQTFALGDVLRVPPKLRFETSPSPPILNSSVTVTCNAESFYPDGATLELFAKDAPSRRGTVGMKILNPDGTFSLKSNLEVLATEDKNSSMFLCQVQHDSQPLDNTTTTVFITQQHEREGGSSAQLSPYVLCFALFLSKIAGIFFLSLFFVIKIRGNSQSRRSFLDEKRNVSKEKQESPVAS